MYRWKDNCWGLLLFFLKMISKMCTLDPSKPRADGSSIRQLKIQFHDVNLMSKRSLNIKHFFLFKTRGFQSLLWLIKVDLSTFGPLQTDRLSAIQMSMPFASFHWHVHFFLLFLLSISLILFLFILPSSSFGFNFPFCKQENIRKDEKILSSFYWHDMAYRYVTKCL